jgi:acyl carrier protein
MNEDLVFAKLKEILISEFEIDGGAISGQKLLYDDLGLDSLDAVDLLVSLKDNLEGKIDPSLFKDAKTIQDVVDILQPLWKAQARDAD